ncbi:NAD(P)/FAD-dependent oxidoreductase [Nocardia camponoti]|uniref:Oxidoreductase n=1 Tax=Nocardia camponoti TaxID=1616106 RepID=A0A917QI61_9NOCA|nr:FAD-dependent oxidoreductase [Nocardia camponoti]GGK51549.1 oxidoreductase [Nocardia camponoti]
MTTQHRIVVIGAGYAGLTAARALARKTRDASITVVDGRGEFIQRVRLHQAAAGQDVKRLDLRKSLGRKGIEFIQARITAVDPAEKIIALDGEWTLHYDTLVYALGSQADRTSVPGVAEHARFVATVEDVAELSGQIVVVGAGATGIELAAELAQAQPNSDITLLGANEPGGWLSAKAHQAIHARLTALGVRIVSGAKVIEVRADSIKLDDGTLIPAATTVWTTGFTVPDLARRAGLAVDADGRIRTDDTLRSISHPDIYAVGDAALMLGPNDRPLRMACATAIPSAQYAAKAIAARARGKNVAPMKSPYVAQCISLGRGNAVLQLVNADDSPKKTVLTGRVGGWAKELIVLGTAWTVGLY